MMLMGVWGFLRSVKQQRGCSGAPADPVSAAGGRLTPAGRPYTRAGRPPDAPEARIAPSRRAGSAAAPLRTPGARRLGPRARGGRPGPHGRRGRAGGVPRAAPPRERDRPRRGGRRRDPGRAPAARPAAPRRPAAVPAGLRARGLAPAPPGAARGAPGRRSPAELAERFLATLRALFRERRAARPPAADAAAAAARHPAVRGAIAHVRSHYARRIPLAALAAELHVSPSHLSRLFRRETGTTLTAFVQQVRLEHARRLLERDDATLAEIAYRVGFQNYRDFYRNWVKREKASPRAVRRRLRARAARRTPDASCG